MGAWGPAIFSDHLACDIRGDYRQLLEDGFPRRRQRLGSSLHTPTWTRTRLTFSGLRSQRPRHPDGAAEAALHGEEALGACHRTRAR